MRFGKSIFNRLTEYCTIFCFLFAFLTIECKAQENIEPIMKVGKFNPKFSGLFSSTKPLNTVSTNLNDTVFLPENFPNKNKHYQEDISKRTLTTRTFLSDDGEIIIQNSSIPVNYFDEHQKLKPIHAKLQISDNGWAAIHQQFSTYLYKNGNTGITGGTIVFNQNCKINGKPIDVLDYTVGEDGMYIKNVKPNIDKKIIFTENRIETDYILHKPSSSKASDFVISEEIKIPNGYSIKKTIVRKKINNAKSKQIEEFETEEYVVYSNDKKEKARFKTPICYDANNAKILGNYNLIQQDNKNILEVIVSSDWLNDASRKYPITIDPLVIGDSAIYPLINMNSCQFPSYESDSLLITIPQNITITNFMVTDSYFADMTIPGVTMGCGFMYLTSPCGKTPVYTVGSPYKDTAGYAYLDDADLKSYLACCFAPSCNIRTFYLAHHLARASFLYSGCDQNYVFYTCVPENKWHFCAYIIGRTIETKQTEWSVYPTPICSNVCTVNLAVTTNHGVPPYTISHPWATGTANYGKWAGCKSTGKDTIQLTIPNCPTICGSATTLSIPPPTIIDVCGVAVTGLSPKNINIKPVPDVVASSTSVCSGNVINIPFTSCVSGTTFTWFGSNGSNGTGNISNNVTNTGNSPITITYSVTPVANGCSGNPINVSATINPMPNGTITPSANSICLGQNVTLVASGGGNYQWSGGSNATTASINENPTTTTTYYLQTAIGNCSDNDSLTIMVNNYPALTVTGNQNICSGQTTTLSANGADFYQWSGGITSNNSSVIVSPTTTTNYYLTGTTACGSSTDTATVLVNTTPLINIINADTTIDSGKEIQLITTGGVNYVWTSEDGLSCNNCPNPIATTTITTTYYVTGTDSNGCLNSDSVIVTVLQGSTLYIPNTFTPNGNGTNDLFYVYGTSIKSIDLKIYNRWGELIFTNTDINKGWDGTYKNNLVEDGVYVYTIKCVWESGKNVYRNGIVNVIH